jgi:threonine synthase
MMHPDGKVSPIQRRQMTTVIAPNVMNIAVDGSFDDCQRLVKDIWHDKRLNKLSLTAVNSINWVRILAQVVYYVYAALSLGAPAIPVAFSVPTGNFGNIYAAHVARKIGVPIAGLVLATNHNDILTRLFQTGKMQKGVTTPSHSPSMDIQVASNFERYLLELCGEDAGDVAAKMAAFGSDGVYALSAAQHQKAQDDFAAFAIDDATTLGMIKAVQQQTGMTVDPHTAVGLAAAAQARKTLSPDIPLISLACAHPAKFGEAIKKATGSEPALPPMLAALESKDEAAIPLANDADALIATILAK